MKRLFFRTTRGLARWLRSLDVEQIKIDSSTLPIWHVLDVYGGNGAGKHGNFETDAGTEPK